MVWVKDVTGGLGIVGEVVEEEGCPSPEEGGAAVYLPETAEMLLGRPEGILVVR